MSVHDGPEYAIKIGNDEPVASTTATIRTRAQDSWMVIGEILPTAAGTASDFALSPSGFKQAGGLVWSAGGVLKPTGGRGTILRFEGRVRIPSDSVEGPKAPNGRPTEYSFAQHIGGYTFEAASGNALVFVLIEKGLVHVSGSGRVTSRSGVVAELPVAPR